MMNPNEIKLDKYLRIMWQINASDLFITWNLEPSVKVNGTVRKIDDHILDDNDVNELVEETFYGRDDLRQQYYTEWEANFAIERQDTGRFRVSCFWQLGHQGVVFRRILTEIPTIEQLKIPEVLRQLVMEKRGLVIFVGATGAGKTTITNLINRFYDIADGKIRYDGININHIKKADLRHSLGIVLQDVNLFTGTVMDNIRYGKLDATDEECIAAAKLANAHDFITRLPDGYNTMLRANGANLSQGQRQLLSIARAAVADPPVMILDEATSSIDTRTELLVQRGMDALMKGRTVFVIAHRLSTVQNSDAIMVLDHGRIIERGTHDDLIAQKGTYYQLYTGAFELE